MKKCDNQLRQTLPRWTSETAITRGALNSKRDEFWETAPKYEGKKVTWNQIDADYCIFKFHFSTLRFLLKFLKKLEYKSDYRALLTHENDHLVGQMVKEWSKKVWTENKAYLCR